VDGVPAGSGRWHARGRLLTVDTVWLQQIYVLFGIELDSRVVHILGVTTNPNGTWVAQAARNLMAELGGRAGTVKFLIRDRDAKFTRAFDEVFRAEGARVLLTPVQAPRAHCFAERWVRTARTECTDWILIRGRRHLEGVLQVYVEHYNPRRPHSGRRLDTPSGLAPQIGALAGGKVQRHDVLGGLILDPWNGGWLFGVVREKMLAVQGESGC